MCNKALQHKKFAHFFQINFHKLLKIIKKSYLTKIKVSKGDKAINKAINKQGRKRGKQRKYTPS